MSTKIKAEQFEISMKEILDSYATEVDEIVKDSVEKQAEYAENKLHSEGSFNGMKYKKSWSYKVENKHLYTQATVYNKKYYRLTHLLEYGHVKQNGGRTRAFPHISTVNDEVEKRFEKEITQGIERIK